ncbi:MAG: 5'/3'-nucleotidase SurE [Anaerolineae bacterium]|nr:5'/3'-nucleotidase SurE [Anaerolineae bacterium]
MNNKQPQILLTNDDGINSPGLWAAAEALSALGYVWVAAPREQSSGAGRSMPTTSDGIITEQKLEVHGKEWTVYAVGGTPAQTVQHAILEIIQAKPDLVVSGINYGANFGTGVTVSGTVGAALEAAAHKIPSIAVSLDTDSRYHLSHSLDIDFAAAAHFTALFARMCLEHTLPADVQTLKVEVPARATIATPWQVTRLSTVRYYQSTVKPRASWNEPGGIGYSMQTDLSLFSEDSDVYTVLAEGQVSVTPLSLDMTSRVDLSELESTLRQASK